MSRVLVERETIYTEEVSMLMKGASYTEVIEFMDGDNGKRKENPFERVGTPEVKTETDSEPNE